MDKILNMLVVEDEPSWSSRWKGALEGIVQDMGYDQRSIVHQALNMETALKIIRDKQIKLNLVTMDIDLGAGNEGLKLLDSLRANQPTAVRVVVSGRATEMEVWREAYERHNVFAVLSKGQDSLQVIKTTFRAALLYAQALQYRHANELGKAQEIAKQGKENFSTTNLSGQFQSLLQDLVALEEARAEDQQTGLAGAEAVRKRINAMLNGTREWEIGLIGIRNYQVFRDHYGKGEGSETIRATAVLLRDAFRHYPHQAKANADEFMIGYLGDDEFLVMSYGDHVRQFLEIARQLHSKQVRSFYSYEHIKRDPIRNKEVFQISEQEYHDLMELYLVWHKRSRGRDHYGDIPQVLAPEDNRSKDDLELKW